MRWRSENCWIWATNWPTPSPLPWLDPLRLPSVSKPKKKFSLAFDEDVERASIPERHFRDVILNRKKQRTECAFSQEEIMRKKKNKKVLLAENGGLTTLPLPSRFENPA